MLRAGALMVLSHYLLLLLLLALQAQNAQSAAIAGQGAGRQEGPAHSPGWRQWGQGWLSQERTMVRAVGQTQQGPCEGLQLLQGAVWREVPKEQGGGEGQFRPRTSALLSVTQHWLAITQH